MNEKKTVLRYIRWFNSTRLIAAILLLLIGLGLAGLAIWNSTKPEAEPQPFDAVSDRSAYYSYLDVIGVSDWVYKYGHTTYYYLMDTDYNFYLAILSDDAFASLSHQNRFMNELTDTETVKRLTGMNKAVPSTVRSEIMEMEELDEDQYGNIFGNRLFNVGETPGANAVAMWGFLAIILLGSALALFLVGLMNNSIAKKAVKRLEEKGLLEKAAAELESPTTQREFKDRFRLGNRFLFGKGSGLAAAWEDVRWVYQSKTTYEVVVKFRSLVICTGDKQTHKTSYRNKDSDEVYALMEAFAGRNPDMLVGYSLDNSRAWREACKKQMN